MKRIHLGLFAATAGCVLALQLPIDAAAGTKEKIVHSFGKGTDGWSPLAGLINANGTLYGTTAGGGTGYAGCWTGISYTTCGTVFSLDPKTGAEKVVYSFCGQQNCTDGAEPQASLINVKGKLYGTTYNGGAQGGGTVFVFDPNTGAETILYSFCSQQACADGAGSQASLIEVKGKLYGTTEYGGAQDYGTVFVLDPDTGAETVLYSFCNQPNCADGELPFASLTDVNGKLYGTTEAGGNQGCFLNLGCGTVFSLDPNTSDERVLYSFCRQKKCADGAGPTASLIDVNGILYGTTDGGGKKGCTEGSCGTVFSLDPSTHTETVLYSFCSRRKCRDGDEPYAGLIDVKGMLYGTTSAGGDTNCNGLGCGTVFSIDPNSGAEKVLHAFGYNPDGATPYAPVIDVSGSLYGTTVSGGSGPGSGTVFSIKP